MPYYPEEVIGEKVYEISGKYQIGPETTRSILTELIESLHEAAFKGTPADTLYGVYRSIGSEAGWHIWGLLYRRLEADSSTLLSDSRDEWHEIALRLDSRIKRFSCILDRWSEEKKFEEEQAALEDAERDERPQ